MALLSSSITRYGGELGVSTTLSVALVSNGGGHTNGGVQKHRVPHSMKREANMPIMDAKPYPLWSCCRAGVLPPLHQRLLQLWAVARESDAGTAPSPEGASAAGRARRGAHSGTLYMAWHAPHASLPLTPCLLVLDWQHNRYCR